MMLRKIGLMLGVSLLITLMMPRRAAMNFNFAPGETWDEETLVAPFDVPVYKEAEQLNAERKALMEEFQPVFRLLPENRYDYLLSSAASSPLMVSSTSCMAAFISST